jgi:hypothetical protein
MRRLHRQRRLHHVIGTKLADRYEIVSELGRGA